MATLAESLGATKPQEQSNLDNFARLNQYYHRFRKLNVPSEKRGKFKTNIFKYISHIYSNVFVLNPLNFTKNLLQKKRGVG